MPASACAACGDEEGRTLCNLYLSTKGQQAIRELAGAMRGRGGKLPSFPGIIPDDAAPIVGNQPDGRELTMARWGMPSPSCELCHLIARRGLAINQGYS